MSWWVKSCAHHEFTIGMLSWWVKSLLLLCFVWHRPKDIAIIALTIVATVVLELLAHGGGASTSRHTIQAQASRQQADIQTHESTWVVQMQAVIQYKHKQADSKHMKAPTSRQQADIQDTRRQHQTHECIGTRQTHKTQDTSTSTIMSHTWKHKQTGSKQTYKTQEEPLQIQECIGAYKTQEDKTDTRRQQQTQ